jgi:arginase
VGAGPAAIAGTDIQGMGNSYTVAAPSAPFEVAKIFEIARAVAGHVADARMRGQRALVLGGECTTALGTIAGAGSEHLGVIWLDSHADFNTPETSASGFLEGMALAMVSGGCWRTLCRSIPGWKAVPPDRVVLAGARSLEQSEREALSEAGLRWVAPTAGWRNDLESALDRLQTRVSRVYLHADLDVIDADEGCANAWGSPGGLTTGQLEEAVDAVNERFTIEAAALTALDPAIDREGRALEAAARLAERLLRLLGPRKPALR